MLSQLVYVSTRKPSCTDEEIEKILASCKKNNPSLEITGVLLYSDTKFIQMVEGEYKLLMELYDKIKLDDRHRNVMMISCGPIKEKAFPSWHMGSRKIPGGNFEFETDITKSENAVFNQILTISEDNNNRVLGLLEKLF